jgi:hypothetical protein
VYFSCNNADYKPFEPKAPSLEEIHNAKYPCVEQAIADEPCDCADYSASKRQEVVFNLVCAPLVMGILAILFAIAWLIKGFTTVVTHPWRKQ